MYNIAKAPQSERDILFQNTSAKMGMNAAIIEKDFWVCLMLDYLFHQSPWSANLTFKGGTSLSKVYQLIERFSEDIDLILDWRVLGYGLNEPWETRSNTKQAAFLKDANLRQIAFLQEVFVPRTKEQLSALLGYDADVFFSEQDGVVNFAFPSSFLDRSILRVIRLEIGAMAAWTPSQEAKIQPYAASYYPTAFSRPETSIKVTTAARTFWEKATILHQEAHRPEGSMIPRRYSRHYYDLFCMRNSVAKKEALAQPDLLEKVASFKAKFYPRNWARYDLARIGSLHLKPAVHSLPALREDYEAMREMIYGDYPTFDLLMAGIADLEKEINSCKI